MKNKKMKVIINVGLILIMLFCFFSTTVQADTKEPKSLDQMTNEANQFINQGSQSTVVNTDEVRKAIMPIAQALVAIANVVLVIVTAIMAIKYMTCPSPDQKAKLKTQLIGLVVSTIVIFGAQVIWATMYKFMSEVTK